MDEITKLEYEKAQDSAEHYNTMTWTLISIIFVFSLLVLRTILLDINSSGWQFSLIGKYTIINGILLVGTLSWIYFGYLIEGANQKKKWKYIVCQEIEKKNKKFLGQHLGTRFLPFTEKEWGIRFFILIKNIFIISFLVLSFLVLYKSMQDEELIWTAIIAVIHLFVFMIQIIFEFKWKNRRRKPEIIFAEVKKLQTKKI